MRPELCHVEVRGEAQISFHVGENQSSAPSRHTTEDETTSRGSQERSHLTQPFFKLPQSFPIKTSLLPKTTDLHILNPYSIVHSWSLPIPMPDILMLHHIYFLAFLLHSVLYGLKLLCLILLCVNLISIPSPPSTISYPIICGQRIYNY